MDIDSGSVFATTNDLISFRYPLNSTGTPSPCSSSSVLLSSPWPISSTPSPPSSTSSSSTCSPPSIQPLNEGTILSLSSSSPPDSSDSISATSPVPMELGFGTGTTAVIFTSTSTSSAPSSSGAAAALTLVDPVSSQALEVAHAPGKSIICVHEQDQGDVIHFSTSCPTNRVNGNGNEEHQQQQQRADASAAKSTSTTSTSNDDVLLSEMVQNGMLSSSSSATNGTTTTTTDGNLFPTLILTSASNDPHNHPGGELHHHMIPMRLYASLTSASPSASIIPPASCNDDGDTSTINGSILTAALGGGDDPGRDGENHHHHPTTCILMTTTTTPGNDDDLQDFVTSNGGADSTTFTLTGFTSTNETNDLDVEGNSTVTTLGTTTILMNDYGGDEDKVHEDLDPMDDYKEYSSSHGKLKDILMNGHSHHHQSSSHHHHHLHHNLNNHSALLSSTAAPSTNGDSYILRDLEAAAVIYQGEGGGNRVNLNSDSGEQQTSSFIIPKEEVDDLEELKLHSVCEDQNSFTDAINSIYNSTTAGRNPFCDGNGDLTTINNGDLVLVSGQSTDQNVYTSCGVITTVSSSSSSLSRSESMGPSVIWTNSGGVVEAIGQQSSMVPAIPPQMLHHHPKDPSLIVKDEDLGDLDEIDEDDLLEAKEEPNDFDYGAEDGDGQGGKGELKCKFCGFVCCSKSSLGIHERRHTGERPFACKYCGRLFNSAQCCKHHERLHTGDKPFQCSYCGKKYAVSTRLKRHERVHTREEPYKCTECNKTFRWFDAFRDHRNTHQGVPLYLCSVCGKTFTSYLKFYYHERGHLMKKERDRDRLAKQREMNGTPSPTSLDLLLAKRFTAKRIHTIPHTIDILQSLQRNSSADIISTLNANAAAIQSSQMSLGGKKGQSAKNKQTSCSPKTNCKKSSKTTTSHNNNHNNNNNSSMNNFAA